jgi:hypothetical protein
MRVKFVHVCAECGKNHCGCPDPEEHNGAGGGYFTLDKITGKYNDIGYGVTEDDLTHLDNSCVYDDKPWPAVIGTVYFRAKDK